MDFHKAFDAKNLKFLILIVCFIYFFFISLQKKEFMTIKQSFISNLLGRDTYEFFKEFARPASIIGAVILILLYVLSYYFHSGFLSYLVSLTNGYSLLFIGYVAILILLLDIEVEVEEPEQPYWEKKKEVDRPFKYKLTIIWSIVLLILSIVAIYYSNRYRNHYAFECETFLVDKKAALYHLDWNSDCSIAEKAEELEERQGYQINEKFKFCEECRDSMDDVESEASLVHARP